MNKEELLKKLEFLPCHVSVDGYRVVVKSDSIILFIEENKKNIWAPVQMIIEKIKIKPLACYQEFEPNTKNKYIVFLWELTNVLEQIENLNRKGTLSKIFNLKIFPEIPGTEKIFTLLMN